jgi:hypothetical protein
MANLIGANGALLYKGILNLDATTINTPLDTTLRAVTDGMGNSSPLQLGTTSVNFGGASGLNWDNVNRRLCIGATNATALLQLESNDDAFDLFPERKRYLIIKNAPTFGAGQVGLTITSLTTGPTPNVWDIYNDSSGLNSLLFAHGTSETGLGNVRMSITSTGNVGIGVTSPTARLHVKGDGSNDVFRVEAISGNRIFGTNSFGALLFGQNNNNTQIGCVNSATGSDTLGGNGLKITNDIGSTAAGYGVWIYNNSALARASYTSGIGGEVNIVGNFGAAAGTASYRPLNITYTINNSGAQTGTTSGIFLNATEGPVGPTSGLNGMTHNLMLLQRGGLDAFSVSRTGLVSCSGLSFNAFNSTNGRILANSNGVFILYNSTTDTFNRLQFGGTSTLFTQIAVQGTVGGTNTDRLIICLADSSAGGALGVGMARTTGVNASAVLQADSTTKGFLPPRMTTAEINLIGTPADGLVVYNTTIGHLCVRAAGVWHKLSHSTM